MTGSDIVLASVDPPSVFNFYPDRETAARDIERANRDTLARGRYAVMTYEEFKAGQRAFYLDGPEEEITAEKFREMLEVLPPQAWTCTERFESFLMSEFHSGVYTHQYIRRGAGAQARYFSKLVDATDKATWMTAEPVRRLYCAVCGELTRGRQWHNRDTGYGVCVACVEWIRSCQASEEDIRAYYGDKGVHYGV